MTHNVVDVNQREYIWHDDDGTDETDASDLEIADATHDFDLTAGNVQARIRILMVEAGGADGFNFWGQLQYSLNSGTYTDVDTVSSVVKAFGSTKLTNDGDTTQQLGSGTFITVNEGVCEDGFAGDGAAGQVDFVGNEEWEYEYTVEFIAADLVDSDVVEFRVLDANNPGSQSYTSYPHSTITIAAAAIETITKATWAQLVEQALNVNEQELLGAETWAVLTGQPLTESVSATETITAAIWALLVEQDPDINEQELLSASVWQVLAGQPFDALGAEIETIVTGTWQALLEQALDVNESIIPFLATWQVLTEQDLSVNEQELLNAATWAVVTGQPLTLLGTEIITLTQATWKVTTGQNINAIDEEQMSTATWAALIGQSFNQNVNMNITSATFAQVIGQVVEALGDEILTIDARTWASLVGTLLAISVDATETIAAGNIQSLTGQPLTLLAGAVEVIGARTMKQFIGLSVTPSGFVPSIPNNIQRGLDDTIRVKKGFDITDIDRDYP